MTDTLARTVEEQRLANYESGTPAKKRRIMVAGIVIGALLGLALFAMTSGPSRAELEQARWQQVVDYHVDRYQLMTGARPESAHWESVVDYYEQQWEMRTG